MAALQAGDEPPRELEELDARTRAQERLMLGLRLDEPLPLDGLEAAIDDDALERMVRGGLAIVQGSRPGVDPHADAARTVPRRRGDGRATGLIVVEQRSPPDLG